LQWKVLKYLREEEHSLFLANLILGTLTFTYAWYSNLVDTCNRLVKFMAN